MNTSKFTTIRIYKSDRARLDKWKAQMLLKGVKIGDSKIVDADFVKLKLDETEQVVAGVLKIQET